MLAERFVDSCSEAYPDLADELDLVCGICEEARECMCHLFSIDESDNPEEELVETPTKFIKEYLELLEWRRNLYARSGYPYPELPKIERKIGILDKVVSQREKAASNHHQPLEPLE